MGTLLLKARGFKLAHADSGDDILGEDFTLSHSEVSRKMDGSQLIIGVQLSVGATLSLKVTRDGASPASEDILLNDGAVIAAGQFKLLPPIPVFDTDQDGNTLSFNLKKSVAGEITLLAVFEVIGGVASS